jgi:hypothetical protein
MPDPSKTLPEKPAFVAPAKAKGGRPQVDAQNENLPSQPSMTTQSLASPPSIVPYLLAGAVGALLAGLVTFLLLR